MNFNRFHIGFVVAHESLSSGRFSLHVREYIHSPLFAAQRRVRKNHGSAVPVDAPVSCTNCSIKLIKGALTPCVGGPYPFSPPVPIIYPPPRAPQCTNSQPTHRRDWTRGDAGRMCVSGTTLKQHANLSKKQI